MNLIIQFTFYTEQKNNVLNPELVCNPDIIKSSVKSLETDLVCHCELWHQWTEEYVQ